MSEKVKNPKIVCFVLLLSAFVTSADTMALGPILDLLATEVFPEFEYSTISYLNTINCLAAAIISVAITVLVRVGKKRLLLIGSVLFTVGGLAAALIPNLYFMLCCRLLEGFGAGMVLTISLMMIPSLFQDQKEIDKVMGVNGVLMALFSSLIAFTSGYMAMVNWRLPFLYYAPGVILFVLHLVYIPNDKNGAEGDAPVSHISKAGWIHAINGFTFGTFSTFFFVCISAVVIRNGIGDASVSGTAATFNTIGSFVSGFVFAAIFGKLKRFSPSVFFAIMAAAIWGLLHATTPMTVYIATFFHGTGWNMFFSAYLAKVSMFSDEHSLDANMALSNGAFYLGQFATPLVMTIIASVTGNSDPVFAQTCALFFLIALAVIHFVCALVGNAKEKASALQV